MFSACVGAVVSDTTYTIDRHTREYTFINHNSTFSCAATVDSKISGIFTKPQPRLDVSTIILSFREHHHNTQDYILRKQLTASSSLIRYSSSSQHSSRTQLYIHNDIMDSPSSALEQSTSVDLSKLTPQDQRELQVFVSNEMQKAKVQQCTCPALSPSLLSPLLCTMI